jgi:1,4-alpha-glucan branching enzyme
MNITVHYEPASPREAVVLHAWEPAGHVWDIPGERLPDGTFRFQLQGDTADPREVQFKYRFPREGSRWEPDDWVRRVPIREATEIWTFDFTPRTIAENPYGRPAPEQIAFHVITQRRFAGGRLFAWQPNNNLHQQFPETTRDEAATTSTFFVPVLDWMREGFHFKLVTPGGEYEPERSNRVWRPGDGPEVWLKSGQVSLRPAPLQPVTAPIRLIYPQTLGAPPSLRCDDDIDDFHDTLASLGTEALDGLFRVARYEAAVYPEAVYTIQSSAEPPSLRRPFRLFQGEAPPLSTAVVGVEGWQAGTPIRDARVRLVFHPNPSSTFGPALRLDVGLGAAPPHETVTAARQEDGTWQADLQAFPGLPNWFEPSPSGLQERREDGSFSARRTFTPLAGGPTTLHTADGVSGLSQRGGPQFQEVPPETRRDLIAAAFGPEIAGGGVFDPWEMPHGPTFRGDAVWFTLRAPHAVQARLLILDPASPSAGPRVGVEHAMALTPDLRYLWCAVPRAAVPHGTAYRFLLNDDQEVLDPASRWAKDPGDLWAKPGEGPSGPWSLVLDPERVAGPLAGSPWRTIGWEALVVYEMHPLRFTRRNGGASSAFDQIVRELAPGRYLQRLGVTALELMPVHEFPNAISWGYNPSLFFAVDSSYGGPGGQAPEELARCVRASHDAGKAVLLDLVFNHLVESPLQAVARDVYVDGETAWGDMVNYDHPAVLEFFRQALVYLWRMFSLDGFRFDATEAIVNGHRDDTSSAPYILARGPDGRLRTGSGGGWAFLGRLHQALHAAADATGRPWPYLVAENDPDNWPLTDRNKPGVLDGQWDFDYHYPLGRAAEDRQDEANAIHSAMDWPHIALRPFNEAVRYGESHDSVSAQEGWKQRIVRREAWGFGRRMAKAVGAAVLLAKGVPMLFMGQEAGEDIPFYFGMDDLSDPTRYLRLDDYEAPGEMARILTWFQHLLGLRNNPDNSLRGDDNQGVVSTPKTVAFTRGWGRFFVIVTIGTPYPTQNLGFLGLPNGRPYKEIFNSTWPEYGMDGEPAALNGGYDARLTPGDTVQMPPIGAVVLERR